MTAASETGRTELVASIADLAEEVARLAHSVERVVAVAKERPRHASKSKPLKAECTEGVNATSATDVLEEVVTLFDEPTAHSKERTGTESLVAAGISDLYERLGGFLKDSLQPPPEPGYWKGGQCPLWVKSGHVRRNKSCPLYSQ